MYIYIYIYIYIYVLARFTLGDLDSGSEGAESAKRDETPWSIYDISKHLLYKRQSKESFLNNGRQIYDMLYNKHIFVITFKDNFKPTGPSATD